jgi:antitoxin MazE
MKFMFANISKWGNSLGIRIPSSIAEQLGISEGVPVELIIEDDHLLIHKAYRLEALLAQITPENIHSEIDTGSPVGKEIW